MTYQLMATSHTTVSLGRGSIHYTQTSRKTNLTNIKILNHMSPLCPKIVQ